MDEILRNLRAGEVVLDLGCDEGSFPAEATKATAVRLDRDLPRARDGAFVQGDAGRLPFADESFAAVISNHSLEHFEDLEGVLREIGRVIRPGGALFVAVPDASTLTDRIYRWLGRGGGHVNGFTRADEVARAVERGTGLRHVATRTLWSSLSFLNRTRAPRPLPKRLWLLGGGFEPVLRAYVRLSRAADRMLGTRSGVYGWAFFFGDVKGPIDADSWSNVCVRCGSGFPRNFLRARNLIRRRRYRGPNCGAWNPFVSA
jgi:SAM-dependent methyltransferase